ncbi:enoyl-CoA hydratase/isomerase family protein [Curtobacterium sp. MCBD17_028]|uniref:enoyl-CoA hydratase/isomerase family protein n=1 Tax=Curtobacterium sp. MCBD17_028 TaxID=2175670 RepID=UPI000DA7D01C|nr:enoyl-CoA hydratase/isomerase family protein [Curtobacterium sp. MCBD17_028]PZE30041.1 enoyl-CoA hydratase/isomerase family protein [Curtobacterium sp. MCBD17_028]
MTPNSTERTTGSTVAGDSTGLPTVPDGNGTPGSGATGSGHAHPWQGIRLEHLDAGVSRLVIDNATRMNAVDADVFREIGEAARHLRRDGTRALVLTGAGDRAFCAGYDLAALPALRATTVPAFLDIEDTASEAVQALHDLPFPVVAAVNGAASGGGLSLALAADVRLGVRRASFNAAFVKVGFSIGELGTSWMLPRVVGPGMAAELAFTGRVVRSDEALAIGLLDRIVDTTADDAVAALQAEAVALATAYAAPDRRGTRIGKRSLGRAGETPSYEVAVRQAFGDRA